MENNREWSHRGVRSARGIMPLRSTKRQFEATTATIEACTMDKAELLRNYGIVPKPGATVPSCVRAGFGRGTIIGQWVALILFGILPILLGLLLLVVVPVLSVRLGLFAFLTLLGAGLIFLIARDANAWVELDGHTLRWKHMFTGRVRERDVGEVEEITTLVLMMKTLTVRIHEGIFGRIRGFEFRFPDMRQGVRIWRADPKMSNVAELIEAVVSRMYERGEVVPEIINLDGKPLVKRLKLRPR
jgi:hypothetical protein